MGKQITADYKGTRPIVIGILKGAWIYLADLLREVDLDVDVDFMSVSSYGSGTSTSGTITIVKDLSVDVTGRDVLIVEDILDSGNTLSYLISAFKARGTRSVSTAVFLDKPERHETEVPIEYKGFTIPDVWVVGYGLDYKEKHRTLPYVAEMIPQA